MNGLLGLNSQQELLKITNALNDVYNMVDKKNLVYKLKESKKVLESNYIVNGNSIYSEKIQNISKDIEKCMNDLELIINQMKAGM